MKKRTIYKGLTLPQGGIPQPCGLSPNPRPLFTYINPIFDANENPQNVGFQYVDFSQNKSGRGFAKQLTENQLIIFCKKSVMQIVCK